MNPKNRITCPGVWAILHDDQDSHGDVVEFYFNHTLGEFCYENGIDFKTGNVKEVRESQLSNLTTWCLIAKPTS